MPESTVSQQIVYTREISRNERVEIRTTLRDLPIGASPNHMVAMLETADFAASMMIDHIRQKMELAVSSFASRPVSDEQIAKAVAGLTIEPPSLDLIFDAPDAKKDAKQPDIPETVAGHYPIFGYCYRGAPIPEEAWSEPYTKTGGESAGGQCKAINTALGGLGITGESRHTAVEALLHELDGQLRPVTTLDILTKAEAMILIEWLDLAPKESLELLRKSMTERDIFEGTRPAIEREGATA
jgi:hypothetical protein